MTRKIRSFVRSETVLLLSAGAALFSMLLAPPGPDYRDYVDWDVLALLFCLMTVVGTIRLSGALDRVSALLLARAGNARRLSLLLALACFFAAMLVTNDVSLLAFVPLALAAMGAAAPGAVIPTVILMTIAANLGSMATPVGNPQNLYLYSAYSLSIGPFCAVVAPYALFALALVCAATRAIPRAPVAVPRRESARVETRRLWPGAALFALCLLAVLKAIPVWLCFVCVLAYGLLIDRRALARVDYSLLLTFVCFFVVVGNLSGCDAVREFLSSRLTGRELPLGALLSQCISNVPAAVLLSSFTDAWQPLLIGVNIGGLGTPVASLASLIAYRLYARSPGARPGRYMAVFLLWNAAFLALLFAFAAAIR